MPHEHPAHSAHHTYTIITATHPQIAGGAWPTAPEPHIDETRLLMVQGLRLFAGVWEHAMSAARAIRCMESLGLRAILVDSPVTELPVAGDERRSGADHYDVALALAIPPTDAELRKRMRLARRVLRPGGTLALTTVASRGNHAHEATFRAPRPNDDTGEQAISPRALREALTAEGFTARVFAWQAAPALAAPAPTRDALPAPRHLLVIATSGDGVEASLIQLRSA